MIEALVPQNGGSVVRVFASNLLFTFSTSPRMRGSVRIGDPFVIIVKVHSSA
jgi:hypothetical protein